MVQVNTAHSPGFGPYVDITSPEHGVLVQWDGKTLWVNVDGVMRLRISRIAVPVVIEVPEGSDEVVSVFTEVKNAAT